MTAGWPASALDALGREVVRRGIGNLLLRLADEFPAFEFGTQRTWNGVSLVAVRRGGADRAGTYVVITSDPGEMRHALMLESGRASARKHDTHTGHRNPPAEGHHGQLPNGTRRAQARA
jgi:hypothetical protein